MNQESRKKVLMLSIDRNILISGNDAYERICSYGALAKELHVVVFSRQRVAKTPVGSFKNVFLYATGSRFRFWYMFDAWRLACDILSNAISKEWLITSQDAFTHPVGIWLRGKFKIALEVQIHTDFMSPHFRYESLLNFCRYLMYRRAIKKADAIRAVSERIWRSLYAIRYTLSAKIYVLPVFVDTQAIAAAEDVNIRNHYQQYNFIVLMASRLSREKRIQDALVAFKIITERLRGSLPLLLILGDGPERKSLEQIAENLGLRDNVVFVGAVANREMPSYYSLADVFLLTSAYEGYGRTVMEAISAKTPVIMTDVGVAGEVITNGVTGTVIPIGNTDKLAEAIFDATQNYPKYQKYASSAHELLMKYAPSQNVYLEKMRRAWEEISYT